MMGAGKLKAKSQKLKAEGRKGTKAFKVLKPGI